MNRHVRLLLPAAVLLAATTLTACGGATEERSAPDPATSSSTPTSAEATVTPGDSTFPDPATVDRTTADATAEAATLLLASWDTVTDRTQTASAVRTRPLMNADWAKKQVEPARNGAQGDWLEPTKHRSYSSPSIVPSSGDVARDVSPTRAIRAYDVTWRWIARDGTDPIASSTRQQTTVYLEKTGAKWQVVGHQITPIS